MKEGLACLESQMAVDQVESSRPKRRTARDLAGSVLRWCAAIQYALIAVRQYLFRSKDLASDVKPADGGVRQLASVADANLHAKAPTDTASASDVKPADGGVQQLTSLADANLPAKAATNKASASDVPADGGVLQLTSVADANLQAKAPTNPASALDVRSADGGVQQLISLADANLHAKAATNTASVTSFADAKVDLVTRTALDQEEEIQRRRNLVRILFNEYWSGAQEKPAAFSERLDQAEEYLNNRLAADGEIWRLDTSTRSMLGLPARSSNPART
jgi:hypothetical protein